MTYAREHVRVGKWGAEDAEQRAKKETDELLPTGVDTPDMLLLVAAQERESASCGVGRAPQQRGGWRIYDMEVVDDQRGRGYGHALFEAAEREVLVRAGDSIGLNVLRRQRRGQRLVRIRWL